MIDRAPSPGSGRATPRRSRRVTRPLTSLLAAAAVLALSAAACTGGGAATPSGAATPASPASPASSGAATPRPSLEAPTALPGTTVTIPAAVTDAAIADAATRSGVDPGAVTIVSAESRDWPSGALGCPKAGFLYTDVITPGYRIVLEARGATYDYRASAAGGGADVRLCENPFGPG